MTSTPVQQAIEQVEPRAEKAEVLAATDADESNTPMAVEVVGDAVPAALEVPADGTPIEEGQRARDERLPARTKVLVRAVFDGKSRHDEVLNWSAGGDASPGGVFVHTTDLLAVGDPVVLTFDGKGAVRPLSLTGRVRWVSPFGRPDDPRPGMGIAFVGASESHRRRLAELLRAAPEKVSAIGAPG